MSRILVINVFTIDVIATLLITILMLSARISNIQATCLLFTLSVILWTCLFVLIKRFEQYEIDVELYKRSSSSSKPWLRWFWSHLSRILLRIDTFFQTLVAPLVMFLYFITTLAMIIGFTGVYAESIDDEGQLSRLHWCIHAVKSHNSSG